MFDCQCNFFVLSLVATGFLLMYILLQSVIFSFIYACYLYLKIVIRLYHFLYFSIYLFISGSCEEEFVFLYLQYVFGFPFSLKIVRHRRRRRRRRQTLEGSFSAVWTATIARKDAFFYPRTRLKEASENDPDCQAGEQTP